MSEEIKKLRCPDCGNTYTPGAKTCRSCGKTLPQPVLDGSGDPDNLEGMPEKDWRDFIGKNAEYYLNIFKNNKNKGFFLKFNWAAFFLGFSWFIYRKMFKQAVVLFFVSLALSFVISIAGVAMQLTALQKALNDYKPYTKYISQDGEPTEEFDQLDEDIQKQVRSEYSAYRDAVSDVSVTASLISSVASIMVNVVIAFLSNWIYRNHVLNKTVRKKGYVASSGDGGTALGAALFIYLFGETIIQLIFSAILIPLMLIFAG